MHTFISNNISAAILKYSLRESSDMRQKLHLTPFTFLVIDFAEPTSYKALCAWIKDVRHHLILFKWGFPEAFIPGSPPCLEYRVQSETFVTNWFPLASHIYQRWISTEPGWWREETNLRKNYRPQKLSFELWLYATLFLIKEIRGTVEGMMQMMILFKAVWDERDEMIPWV